MSHRNYVTGVQPGKVSVRSVSGLKGNWASKLAEVKQTGILSFKQWSNGRQPHLNPVGSLPCVGPKTWIEVPVEYDNAEVRELYEEDPEQFVEDGGDVVMVLAVRPGVVERKNNDLVYHPLTGGEIVGRFRWAYY